MNALEKKLASAIEELIGQVIGLHPDLKKPFDLSVGPVAYFYYAPESLTF